MKFVFYPTDIEKSTAEYSGNSEFQGGFYRHLKYLAKLLTAQDKGDAAAAAVAMMNFAYKIDCEIRFMHNEEGGYDKVEIQAKQVKI